MKSFFTVLLLIGVVILSATTIDIYDAKQVAKNWQFERSGMTANIYEILTEKNQNKTLYYIFNLENNGYIIVSADDAVVPILGYNFEHNFTTENHPPQFDAMLENFKQQIIYVQENNLLADSKITKDWQRLNVASNEFIQMRNLRDVSPLLATNWDQDSSWNADCPADGSGPGGHVYAGCVAVATVQVMKYWEHPQTGTGSHSYVCSPYGTLSANFGATTYDWSSMSNTSPTNATRELLYHCGVAVEMEYSGGGSGAWVGYYSPSALTALENYFGYHSEANFKLKSSYSDSQWEGLVRTELDNGRPLVYRGYGDGGHAFNLDGYQGTNYFHFNWGWSGSYNGHYYLTNLNPGGMSFTDDQGGLFNVRPDNIATPGISVTPSSFNQNLEPNETANQTMSITNNGDSGSNLTYSISVAETRELERASVNVNINFDNYASETSWDIKLNGSVVQSGSGYSNGDDQFNQAYTFDSGNYTFSIYDSYGDGICCGFGDGSYTVTVDGTAVASGGEFESEETTAFTIGEPMTWLSVNPTSGNCGYNQTDNITLSFDATGLSNGTYTANLAISNNAGAIVNRPVTLTVDIAGTITVIQPNGGESYLLGSSHNINWNSENVTGNVRIYLYKEGSYYRSITSNTANNGDFLWTIPENYDVYSSYKIKVTSISNSSVYDFSDNYFELFEDSIIYGDVDGNGNVQAMDASLTLQYVVDMIAFTEEQLIIADVDGNGSVQAYDASLILMYAVGIIDEFPVEGRIRTIQMLDAKYKK
jgi:hypothetical protein